MASETLHTNVTVLASFMAPSSAGSKPTEQLNA
jgi:hypothetical protein